MEGRCPQPIDIVAEIDVGEVSLHDLVLGQPGLQPEGDQRLPRLAAEGAVGGQEHALGKLLRDRAAALRRSAGPEIMPGRPRYAPRVDAPMAAEPPVLYRHERSEEHTSELQSLMR